MLETWAEENHLRLRQLPFGSRHRTQISAGMVYIYLLTAFPTLHLLSVYVSISFYSRRDIMAKL